MFMLDKQLRDEIIKKYRWAGRIRLISFLLLFAFLLMMKFAGGYSYLNPALSSLIFVEAVLNQPYIFILKRVNILKFLYYQLFTDVIAISWILYYMGGIEAPVVSIAYYAIILWAGFIAGTGAVIFTVTASCILFSSIVLLEYFGALPRASFLTHDIPMPQVFSLLIGNVSFMFAFGYFSARSSVVIKDLQRKRQEELLRHTHRLSTTGYLLGETAHDIQGCLAAIRGSVQVLLSLGKHTDEEKKFLMSIEDCEKRGAALIQGLARFSRKPVKGYAPVDINKIVEDAVILTQPLIKYSKMLVGKEYEQDIPLIISDKDQMQEVFVALLLNSLDSVSSKAEGGKLDIKTRYLKDKGLVEIIFADTGAGIKEENLKHIGEPFFSTKKSGEGSGLGLATAYAIIARHNGRIDVQGRRGEGATFVIQLPAVKPANAA